MMIATSRVVLVIAAVVGVFTASLYALSVDRVIIVLNALFVGTSVAIAVSYWRLFINALAGHSPYDRVRQMTWGFFLCWLAIAFGTFGSIYTRLYELPTQTTVLLALSRFFAIGAAILQVTAPDFGQGLFHGRDRKLLAGSIVIGLAVAIILIYGQGVSVLAHE
jgi:hypothetical protein